MKKLTLLFFCVIIMLTSCTNEPAPISKCFKGKVSATCNGLKLNATINCNCNKIMNIRILSPKSMKDYNYTYKNNRLTIEYNGMKAQAKPSYIPKTAFTSIIYNVISSLTRQENCYYSGQKNNLAIYKGNSDSGKYELTADFSTGAIKQIEIKDHGFTGKFYDIELIN